MSLKLSTDNLDFNRKKNLVLTRKKDNKKFIDQKGRKKQVINMKQNSKHLTSILSLFENN